MDLIGKTARGILLYSKVRLRGSNRAQQYAGIEPPLRAKLFSADQMEQHGQTLAGAHQLRPGRPRDRLLKRLAENEGVLVGACNLLIKAVKTKRRIAPAGEWLLDNFYLIEEQIRTARRHLPKGYSRELPRLLNGPSAGLPRVYDITLETISHGDGRVDPENLSRFVAAYQKVAVLKLGELWAIPIMLRLALIENLRRVAARIVADWFDRDLADTWADQMTEIAEHDPKSLITLVADMARSRLPMTSAFVAELARRLQGRGPALALPLTWVEQWLSEAGLTIKQLVQSENQQLAADQVSVSNSIGSLRFLSAMDWRDFVETMSTVEQTLREDPGDVYGRMDFATRDRYRHVVEKTAKTTRHSESEVARQAVQLAQAAAAVDSREDRAAHVGFYLIDKGLGVLEQRVQMRLSPAALLRKVGRRFPLLLYIGAILVMTGGLAGGLMAYAHADGVQGWGLGLIGILALLCASHLAVALVNWLTTLLATPHPLPRMDFSKGIPPELRTLVVVPTMLTNTQPLLRLARQGIDALNEKYRRVGGNPFFLCHRPRRWNPQDRVWMGFERKRGKLADVNRLLRGGAPGTRPDGFALVDGDTAVLPSVKYVITLDTDTQLPRDAARQFVGVIR